MNAIPTTYDGINFRSRLEARWAAFFTAIGWQWEYEPFDGNGYIPDFLIQGDEPLLIEVKPAITRDDFHEPTQKIERGLVGLERDVLIVGTSPLPKDPGGNSGSPDMPAAGLLAQWPCWDGAGNDKCWAWDSGSWFRCGVCKKINVFHEIMSFHGRPCGHYDGDHYLEPVGRDAIAAAWATATNSVQWRGR